MWSELITSIAIYVLIVFVPGYIALKGFAQERFVCIGLAPCISVGIYAVLGTVLSLCDVFCNWAVILLPTLVICALPLIIRLMNQKVKRFTHNRKNLTKYTRFDNLLLVIYILIAAVVTLFVFVRVLDTPSAVGLQGDNEYHLGRIKEMLDYGNWSSIGKGVYLYYGTDYISPTGTTDQISASSIYPSAWHVVVAMVANITGANAAIAMNACTIGLLISVFPTGMLILARKLFKQNKLAILCTGICMMCFGEFQWCMITSALISNLSAMCLLPSAITIFLSSIKPGARKQEYLTGGFLFAISFIAIALSQPNCIFTMAIILLPYCVSCIVHSKQLGKLKHSKAIMASLSFLILLLFAIFWTLMYLAPFMVSIIHGAVRPAYATYAQSIVDIITLAFRWGNAQLLLGSMVIVGIICSLVKKWNRWFLISVSLLCFLYFIGSTTDGFAQYFFTGFWYTDQQRIAAAAAFCAIPFAGLGLSVTVKAILRLIKKASGSQVYSSRKSQIGTAVISVIFLVCVLYPNFTIRGSISVQTAFGRMHNILEKYYGENHPENWYSKEERSFVDKVNEIVNQNAVIMNIPADGSSFSYGANDLNVYYRSFRTGNTEADNLIRKQLSNYSSDKDVQTAVKNAGIQYVLFLDYQNDVAPNVDGSYNANEWVGVNSITDDTPGFELVLQEGDMRLYRINDEFTDISPIEKQDA